MQFISVQICKTGCIKSEAISSWGYLFSALNVAVGGGVNRKIGEHLGWLVTSWLHDESGDVKF